MRVPPELDPVRTALFRRGVPPAYTDRLMGELAEHREELIADLLRTGMDDAAALAEADRRMGTPTAIADAAVSVLRDAIWAVRHPILALVIAPALALPLGWGAILLTAAAVSGMISPSFQVGSLSDRARALLSLSCAACTYVVPAAASAAFYIIARRQFVGRARAWTPPLVLAAVSSFAFVRVFLDSSSTVTGRLVVGADMIPDPLRFLLPLGVVLLLELSSKRSDLPARAESWSPPK